MSEQEGCHYSVFLTSRAQNWISRTVVVPSHQDSSRLRSILQDVFAYGQNRIVESDYPDVAVGDVIQVGNCFWLMCDHDFRRLTTAEFDEYCVRMSLADRLVSPLLRDPNLESFENRNR